MVDDHSRLAYAEVLDNLTASCSIAFLRRAIAWFAERGVQVRALTTVPATSLTDTPTL